MARGSRAAGFTLIELLLSVAIMAMVIGVAIPPARLLLPAASVKVAAATEIEPGAVELAVGVKIAV